MGPYSRYILPHLVHRSCGVSPVAKQRLKIIPHVHGDVVEVGIGSGLNLPFYDRLKVKRVWGIDPSRRAWSIAEKEGAGAGLDVTFVEGVAASIPLDNGIADTVVITYTLCTIPDAAPALAEVRRLLKPGGQLVFCEHGVAPDAGVRRLQNFLNPFWKIMGGGCHLNRDIPAILDDAGFRDRDMEQMYIPGPKFASYEFWGAARPM